LLLRFQNLRGPLGGESLASIIGRRREELLRKKEQMGVTSPTSDGGDVVSALKKENSTLRGRTYCLFSFSVSLVLVIDY
jgi:hypothetical protein